MLINKETSKAAAADKAGMDPKTALKYRKCGKLPSQLKKPHEWRTRMRTALNFFHPARRTSSSYRGELLPPSAANFFHFVTPPATV